MVMLLLYAERKRFKTACWRQREVYYLFPGSRIRKVGEISFWQFIPQWLIVVGILFNPYPCVYSVHVFSSLLLLQLSRWKWDHHGHDRMVVKFTTTYAISAYHH